LLAALELASEGAKVTLMETSGEVGGRASTRNVDGYLLNRGPHALYANGAFKRELDRYTIKYSGGRSLSRRRQAIVDGRLYNLPTTLGSIATTPLFGFRDKLDYLRVFTSVKRGETSGGSFKDWLDRQNLSPIVRSTVEAIGRLSSYANCPGEVSAQAMLDQIRLASGGTMYIDGGWASLVSGLAEAASIAGVDIRKGAPVSGVRPSKGNYEIFLADGSSRTAHAVILAVAPQEAGALIPDVLSLNDAVEKCSPVRANTLDIGLKSLPPRAHDFALGINSSVYLSVHSGSAKLAPEGGAVVHVAKYLGVGEKPALDCVAELEAVADLAMPGWRDREVTRQTLRGMVVSHAVPSWRHARADIAVPGAPRLFVAGDWVGTQGMLADAAAESAVTAARSALRSLRSSRSQIRLVHEVTG
jgi:phytoene dehydrogenase-like protein